MKINIVKEFCELKQLSPRKDRYRIMAEYFGIEGETIKDMISFDRYLRLISDADEKGLELERDWRPSHEFKLEENRLFELSTRVN